jgi:hypothetical protein
MLEISVQRVETEPDSRGKSVENRQVVNLLAKKTVQR